MVKIQDSLYLDFDDVLIRPKRSGLGSRNDVDLNARYTFKHSKKTWEGVPILASNMDTIGTFEIFNVLKEHKLITCFHKFYKHYDFEQYGIEKLNNNKDYYMLSTGIRDQDYNRLQTLMKDLEPNFVCIDVANGYSNKLLDFVRKVRESYPYTTLVAGNVVTREMVEDLIENGGIDICKIGIGNGSVCTTRLQTGVGMPQFSAVMECADAAHGMDGHIISDGGVKNPGDISKAFGANADFVMSGSLFSGHEECAGETIEINGKKFKQYYGMSSDTAMNKRYGGVANYRSSEGKTVTVPYKGHVNDTILNMLGGIRSTCTYIGARRIKDLPKCTSFIKVSRQVNTLFN